MWLLNCGFEVDFVGAGGSRVGVRGVRSGFDERNLLGLWMTTQSIKKRGMQVEPYLLPDDHYLMDERTWKFSDRLMMNLL